MRHRGRRMSGPELLVYYLGAFQRQTLAPFLLAAHTMDKERVLLLFFRLYLQ